MIQWFLRLFPAFLLLEAHLVSLRTTFDQLSRDLAECRAALADLSTEKLMLQDRLDAALADRDQLWSTMQQALTNERDALRMQVNHAVQKSGGGIPYPDSHSLPATSVRPVQQPGPVGRRGRILASEAGRRQTDMVIEKITRKPV